MKKDKIRLGPQLEDGRYLAARRKADSTEEHIGIVRLMKDGDPLAEGAELLHIDGNCQDGWHDADVVYERTSDERSSSGPAQVATPAYREGYDRIFGKKQPVGLA